MGGRKLLCPTMLGTFWACCGLQPAVRVPRAAHSPGGQRKTFSGHQVQRETSVRGAVRALSSAEIVIWNGSITFPSPLE